MSTAIGISRRFKMNSSLSSRAVGCCILVVALLLFAGCSEEKVREKLAEESPKITLETFSLTETKQGDKLWILDAEQARVYDEVIKVDNVKIRFFNKDQVEFSVLHAPGGILNTNTHNILVGDTVAVFTSDSTKLFTDSLFWHNDSQKILTDCPVTIIKGDGTIIKGRGLRADPHLNKIEVIGDAQGVSPIELPSINR